MTMTIHRPDWERTMTMAAWTAGDDRSLVRVTRPGARTPATAPCLMDGNMWTYTPKINRIIKIPASMMNQNWMGSDFSNKRRVARRRHRRSVPHRLLETRSDDGHTSMSSRSVPCPRPPWYGAARC
jgi:hypothetical protein